MSNKLTYDITSLNVRGLREQRKKGAFFSYLKAQKSKLYFLQETYSEVNDKIIWINEWGSKIFFSHGTKHSKVVCILINPLVQDKINYSFSDKSGRIGLLQQLVTWRAFQEHSD